MYGMKIAHHIAHLFIPRESNNQKAKLLHNSTLALIAIGLVFLQLILSTPKQLGKRILGYAANISPDEVIRLTNEKRASNGLAPLSVNLVLSQAAQAKGVDMINRDYWAHVSPDGTQPWKFFTDFGYKYRYAGENLARDFSNSSSAVDAWMASPSHRENMLSSKYREIGIGVIEGDLAGVDTTIIVQFFGAKYGDVIPTVPVARTQPASTIVPQLGATSSPKPIALATSTPSAVLVTRPVNSPLSSPQVLVSPFNTTKGISVAVVGVLLLVLIIDGLVVSRRRIARIGGRTFAHMAFLGMILAIALILRAGQIL